jgi:hypothetical protein
VSSDTDAPRAAGADGTLADGGTLADEGGVDADDGGVDVDPRPATYYHLARAVLYREYLIFVRYPANAIGGIVVALFFFGVLFYGGQLLAGQALTDSLEGIIVGYFLWTLSVGAYSSVSNDIGSEVQWGTLERHITTPFGFAPVALLKGIAKVVRTFLTSALVLAVMLVLTGATARRTRGLLIHPVTRRSHPTQLHLLNTNSCRDDRCQNRSFRRHGVRFCSQVVLQSPVDWRGVVATVTPTNPTHC